MNEHAPPDSPGWLVIYHGPGCPDGFCAAWILHRILDGAFYHPAQYGKPPPDVAGRHVEIVDFSYPRETLLAMAASARTLQVYDHHATAERELEGLDFCHFDMAHSGARLTWDAWNRPNHPRPWLVDYTEDRDLWPFALPHSQAINAALASYPQEFDAWDALAARDPLSLVPEGEAILRYQERVVDGLVTHARAAVIGGYSILAVNTPVLISETAGRLAEGDAFAACWYENEWGRRIWSLRSDEDGEDVAEIARQNGGGGHPRAAGFTLPPGERP